MTSRLKSRLKKLEEEARLGREVIVVWKTDWGPGELDPGLPPEKLIDSFTRPVPSEGFDVRCFPYLITPEIRAWVIENWDRIIPMAKKMLLEKDEEIRSHFGGEGIRERGE